MESFILKIHDKKLEKIRTILIQGRIVLSNVLRELDGNYEILNLSVYNGLEHDFELLGDLKPKNLELGKTDQESTNYDDLKKEQ